MNRLREIIGDIIMCFTECAPPILVLLFFIAAGTALILAIAKLMFP